MTIPEQEPSTEAGDESKAEKSVDEHPTSLTDKSKRPTKTDVTAEDVVGYIWSRRLKSWVAVLAREGERPEDAIHRVWRAHQPAPTAMQEPIASEIVMFGSNN